MSQKGTKKGKYNCVGFNREKFRIYLVSSIEWLMRSLNFSMSLKTLRAYANLNGKLFEYTITLCTPNPLFLIISLPNSQIRTTSSLEQKNNDNADSNSGLDLTNSNSMEIMKDKLFEHAPFFFVAKFLDL